MPKDILNVVFAPKRFSEITDTEDIISWHTARKQMRLYHSKPFLVGNPKSIKAPAPYPNPKSSTDNEPLRDLICLWWGDITQCRIESIVNSANIKLKYGGGVCGAIHRRAGPQLYRQCIERYPDGRNVTECALTDGFQLPARFVVHAVGPAQIDYVKLSATYKNALKLCIDSGIKEVCFCCIGCGTHQLPIKMASKVAVYSVIKFLNQPYARKVAVNKESNIEMIGNEQKEMDLVDDKDENPDGQQQNEIVDGQQSKDEKEVVEQGSDEISNVDVDESKEEPVEVDANQNDEDNPLSETDRLARDYFTKIVFNCWTESEVDAYKCWLTEQLG